MKSVEHHERARWLKFRLRGEPPDSAVDLRSLPTVPAWADVITVQPEGSTLIVHCEKSCPYHPVPGEPGEAFGDLLKPYWAFVKAFESLLFRQPAHIQFAAATGDEQLTDFVRRFGAVMGRFLPESLTTDCEGFQESFTVVQELSSLRHEQEVFRRGLELLIALRHKSASEVVNKISALADTVDHNNESWMPQNFFAGTLIDASHIYAYQQRLEGKSEEVFYAGHAVMCRLLNRFPPRLVPCRNGAISVPDLKYEGILPSLYFMLQTDYLSEREIDFCHREQCGQPFRVTRRDSPFCSDTCARRVRQREYYWRKGKKTRACRRKRMGARNREAMGKGNK